MTAEAAHPVREAAHPVREAAHLVRETVRLAREVARLARETVRLAHEVARLAVEAAHPGRGDHLSERRGEASLRPEQAVVPALSVERIVGTAVPEGGVAI